MFIILLFCLWYVTNLINIETFHSSSSASDNILQDYFCYSNYFRMDGHLCLLLRGMKVTNVLHYYYPMELK